MAARGLAQHLAQQRPVDVDLRDQPIALAQQEVARVERDGHAVLGVQRALAVALVVAVLDVVVHQRGLVEALDRSGELHETSGRLRALLHALAGERHVHAGAEVGSPALAVALDPLARDLVCHALRRAHDASELRGREPALHLALQSVEVESVGLVVRGEMDHVPDLIRVDVRVDAVVLQERDRDARDRDRLHMRETLLEHVEAADPDDGLDLPGLDHAAHDGGALGHQHGVAQALRLGREVLDRAQAALLAEQTELVEGRGAVLLDAQALWDQEQPALEGHARQLVAPGLVVEQHGRVVGVALVEAGARAELLREGAQVGHRDRRHEAALAHELRGRRLDAVAVGALRGDVRLRLAPDLQRDPARERGPGCTGCTGGRRRRAGGAGVVDHWASAV